MATENNEPKNEQNEHVEEPKVTLEDLQTQLKDLQAQNERYKNAISKANAESADWKRKFRERQTAEEAAADAKREAEELQKERMNQVEKELAVLKATNRYLKQGMDEKLARECAELESESDMETLLGKIKTHNDARLEAEKKAWQEEYLKSRPDIKAGNGEDGGEEEDLFLKGFNNPDLF